MVNWAYSIWDIINIIYMSNFYKSLFYSKPIEVCNIDGEIIVIITDDLGRETIYSWYDIQEKTSQSIYINKCLLWGFVKKTPKSVLIVWFWWGAFAKYLEDYIDGIKITWIDIDEAMMEIAKKEFWVETKDLYILDALEALKILIRKKKKYDLVLIDVYWSDWEVPNYFQQEDFSNKIKEVLFKDWVISMNFSNYELANKKYEKIHSNFISVFWKYYSHFLSGKNDRWNIVWVYNLDKNYNVNDYNFNYLEKVQNSEILYDWNIIKDTFLN